MGIVAEARVTYGPADNTRLARVVSRFADPAALSPSHVLMAGNAGREAALGTLLREIDETVLPREIVVDAGQAGRVRLSVSNRRLLGAEAEPAGDTRAEASDPNALAHLAIRRIKRVLDGATEAAITLGRRTASSEPGAVSCTARSLAKAGDLSADALGGPDGLRSYVEALRPVATACLFLPAGGRAAEQDGDPALVDGLQAFRAQSRPDGKPRIASSKPACKVLPLPGGPLLVAAHCAGEEVFALVPQAHQKQVLSAWQKRF